MATSSRLKLTAILLVVFAAFAPGADAQETAMVTGVISDALDPTPLPFANAVVSMPGDTLIHTGASSGENGRYVVPGLQPGRYAITVSYTGFETQRFEFTLAAGATRTLNFFLEEEAVLLDQVVVSAGALPAKVMDSPSAVDVLYAEDFEQDVTSSPIERLRSVPGLDMARTGIDRRELVIRGFGKTFTGATYVMTDYRQSAIPSLGVNAYNMMPISSIDLEQVEVVRGPASAVYGPGVDEGAIHFISKDPFRHPGTTIAISGGQRSMMQGELRHAGVIRGRIGYKVNAQYLRAEDWALDLSDPHDIEMKQRYYTEIPLDTDVTKLIVSGMTAYRFDPQTTLTAAAGFASAKSPFLSDIGPLQSDGFGYRYGQLRLSAGRFFAQVYLNANDAGDSFVYAGPGVAHDLSGKAVIDNSTQLNAQTQYSLDLFDGLEKLTVGIDFERTNPDTEGTINGRNDEDDRILEYGVYAQSLTTLSEKVSVTTAARLDYDNIFETLQVSPRAAIVYKPVAEHSVRASFNRAFASAGTNSLFLDIIALESPLLIRARGAKDGYTFARNAAYAGIAGSDLIATSLIPHESMLGRPHPVGLPLDAVYGLIYDRMRQIPVPDLARLLCDRGVCIPEEHVAYLVNELSPQDGTAVTGFTPGGLGLLDLSSGSIEPVSDAHDVAPLKQSTTQSFELGYRGFFGGRIGLSVDAYYTVKENFLRGLQLETPLVFVPGLRDDLHPAIAAGVEGNPELMAALDQLGIPPSAVADILMALSDPDLPAPTTPVAVVQPMQNNTGIGQVPELLMTYRNFGRVEYFGLEAAVDVYIDTSTTVQGSLSWVNDDFFDHQELDEENEELSISLNAPTFKAGAAASHRFRNGLSLLVGGKYVQGFTVRSGPYNGFVNDYFLLDVGAGYDFGRHAPGLRLDVTVQNVLDHMHREFVGAPKMGRLGLARLTYSFK